MTRAPVMVYTAGKMSGHNARAWWKNIRTGKQVAFHLMSNGYLVFCPHLSAYFDECEGYDAWTHNKWLVMDGQIILRCDVVLMLDNWKDSPGATREHTFAVRHGVPIVYSVEELDAYRKSLRRTSAA